MIQDEDLEYECVLDVENQSVVVEASVEPDADRPSVFFITCQPHQVSNKNFLCLGVMIRRINRVI